MPLESIRALVLEDLKASDQFIMDELNSEILLINQMLHYILSSGGKRIRPLLVLLSARAFNDADKQQIKLAAAIELVHTATLLHDDVVDNSNLRRGHETAHTIWGNEASVLVGDFLYSRAFQIIVQLHNLTVMDIFASATNLIAEGEVLQLMNCKNAETTESAYFDVIQRKTGKLFEVSAQLGPALHLGEAVHLTAMQTYGMNLGIAYQLIDDALDYSASTEELGKSIGKDLAEGKPTLPLIYALTHCSKSQAKLIKHAIEKGCIDNLPGILEIIESTQAIKYTIEKAKHHAFLAITALTNIPDSLYRTAMQDLAEFVVNRKY